jgi:hypothetical protein
MKHTFVNISENYFRVPGYIVYIGLGHVERMEDNAVLKKITPKEGKEDLG